MKSVRRTPRNIAIAFALTLAFAFGFLPCVARAADETHWLTPSHYAVDKNGFYGTHERAGTDARTDRTSLAREGAVLYGVHCSTCHGTDLAGGPGAPSLLQAGGAAVDFYMTTGRMPIALRSAHNGPARSPLGASVASGAQDYHIPPLFDAHQTLAIDAYVDARAHAITPIPHVILDRSQLTRGRRLFENNCQACHGAGAQGATAGTQWVALPLDKATPTQIGEAIRVGPGVMPRFTTAALSASDVDAVATYVRALVDEPQTYGGTTLGYLGPVAEGAIGAIVGVGFLFWVIYFTGTRADGRRLNELDPRAPPHDR